MTTVQDEVDAIKAYEDYVEGSLYYKSYDDTGCVIKWISRLNGIDQQMNSLRYLIMMILSR